MIKNIRHNNCLSISNTTITHFFFVYCPAFNKGKKAIQKKKKKSKGNQVLRYDKYENFGYLLVYSCIVKQRI